MRLQALEPFLAAGLSYLQRQQSTNGSWTDWKLPPGKSSVWTTAYVGYRLQELPTTLKSEMTGSVEAASQWLLAHRFEDGGWGYNQITGSDADSTAFAILMLHGAGCKVPDTAYEHLIHYQQDDGGFSTFQPAGRRNSWTVSHPDVTPMAALALLTNFPPGHPRVLRAIARVRYQQTPAGIWNSFWWDSFLYGTEASLSLLRAAGATVPMVNLARTQPSNSFETALLVSIFLNVGVPVQSDEIKHFIRHLLDEQRTDGSWPSRPILRITRRSCFHPWDAADPGPLFADPERLFTTATVIHALCRVHSALRKHSDVPTSNESSW